MSTDREYKAISGNPRRDTPENNPDSSESGKDLTENESTEDSNGAPSAPNGNQSGSDGPPTGSNGGPSGPNGDDSGTSGASTGPKEAPTVPDGDPSSNKNAARDTQSSVKKAAEDENHPRMPSGRKRRVKVTPRDWTALEETARALGVGHATVYRIAFQQFVNDLEDRGMLS